MQQGNYNVLKIYASSTDKIGTKLLYEYIVGQAKAHKVSGVTVYRGVMGYGSSSSHISTSRFWELTEKLPVMIELVDTAEILEDFYQLIEPELIRMPKGCLVTLEPVEVRLLKPGRAAGNN
jgi:PII-like signaling protein